MDTWLADTSTARAQPLFGNTGQGRQPWSPAARRLCLRVWGTVCWLYAVRRVAASVVRPWKASATAAPLRRGSSALVVARPRQDGRACTPCMQLDGSRLTGTRAAALPVFASHPFLQRQRRARSPLHLAIGRSKPASHQPAESPSLQVPSPSLSCTPSTSQAQPQRTHQTVSGWP